MSSSQGPLAVIAPKPPSADFPASMPIQFAQEYQGSQQAHAAAGGSQSSNMPAYSPHQQELPSPHLLTPESATATINTSHFMREFPGFGGPQQGFENHQAMGQLSPVSDRQQPFTPFMDHKPPVSFAEDIFRPAHPMDNTEEYWQSDDEASMIDSDDEAPPEDHFPHLESNDLGVQVARHVEFPPDIYGVHMRTVTGFTPPNILQTYVPSSKNSPLNDAHTAAVFWHFVNVTGRIMSLYERHPVDPSPMFQGQPVPKARQHIWACKCRDVIDLS